MKKLYLVAAVMAAICGFLVYSYMNNLKKAYTAPIPETPMVKLVAAASDIPRYTEIDESMVILVDYPEEYAHGDSARAIEDVVGKRCDGDIKAGEIILTTVLGDADDVGASLSRTIPTDMRALTISVGVENSVAGFIVPGDHLDLIAYEAPLIEGAKGMTYLALEDVEVLAVGNVSQQQDNNYVYTELTLLLSSAECVKVTDMELQTGSQIYAALRSRRDE